MLFSFKAENSNFMISIIVAMDEKNGIGKDGKLLAHLPNDLRWFKKHTINHTVIMGRKTYQSLPNGALPNRRNIVLSRSLKALKDAIVVNKFEQIWDFLNDKEENFVIGGAEIYRIFLPFAQKLYITRIHHVFDADTFFPQIDLTNWQLIEKIFNPADEKNKYSHTFLIYKRKN